jgi:hypothetical protein
VPTSPENSLREQIEIVSPDGELVSSGVNVPDVRHVLLFEIHVRPLADVEETVLVAARNPEPLQLVFGLARSRTSSSGALVFGADRVHERLARVAHLFDVYSTVSILPSAMPS